MKFYQTSLLVAYTWVVIDCVSLTDDPSLWPGHMEPFGSKQKKVEVEVLHEFPDPITFFRDYLDASRPALFKGLAKRAEAYKLWDDHYLRNLPGSENEMVYVEPELKEVRTKPGWSISLKEFIDTYHTAGIYMVHGLPKIMRKDMLMPAPLRCNSTRQYLLDAVTWFSGGGTKSVVHNDDLDNINCLVRGSKKLLFVSYKKNKHFVPIDRPEGGYSSLDVDAVDYTKFPQLRKVDEYVEANMEEGDCLFIPFQWYHQVNSKANEKGQNIAVNVWFKHTHKHQPEGCDIAPEDATMDKYTFHDLEKQSKKEGDDDNDDDEEEQDEMEDDKEGRYLGHFGSYLTFTKKNRANFVTFLKIYAKDEGMTKVEGEFEMTDTVKIMIKELFDKLNVVPDKFIDEQDFDKMDAEAMTEDIEKYLVTQTAIIEREILDVEETRHHGDATDVPTDKHDPKREESKSEL